MNTRHRIVIRHVDPKLRHVDAVVTHYKTAHRIGHLATEGWFCVTCQTSTCPRIEVVRALVTPMEQP